MYCVYGDHDLMVGSYFVLSTLDSMYQIQVRTYDL